MPSITKYHLIEITPEQFLDACSPVELHEVSMLLCSKRYQDKMNAEGAFEEAREIIENEVPDMPVIPKSLPESSYPEKRRKS